MLNNLLVQYSYGYLFYSENKENLDYEYIKNNFLDKRSFESYTKYKYDFIEDIKDRSI